MRRQDGEIGTGSGGRLARVRIRRCGAEACATHGPSGDRPGEKDISTIIEACGGKIDPCRRCARLARPRYYVPAMKITGGYPREGHGGTGAGTSVRFKPCVLSGMSLPVSLPMCCVWWAPLEYAPTTQSWPCPRVRLSATCPPNLVTNGASTVFRLGTFCPSVRDVSATDKRRTK